MPTPKYEINKPVYTFSGCIDDKYKTVQVLKLY